MIKISRDFRKLTTSKVHHQKGILMDSRVVVTGVMKPVFRVNQI